MLHFRPSGVSAPLYCAVGFSDEPVADLISSVDPTLQIVRHLGVRGSDKRTNLIWNHAESHSLTLALSGDARVRGRIGGRAVDGVLTKGSISFAPARAEVALELPSNHACLAVAIDAGRAGRLLSDSDAALSEVHVGLRNDRLRRLIELMVQETARPGFGSDLLIDSMLRAIAGTLANQPTFRPDPDRIRLTPRRMTAVREFVRDNLDRRIGLPDLARAAGLSAFHFSRVFKQTCGQTPYQFVITLRVERACSLLSEGRLALAELALTCGFANQPHFTAAFTREMGLSPGRFRNRVAL